MHRFSLPVAVNHLFASRIGNRIASSLWPGWACAVSTTTSRHCQVGFQSRLQQLDAASSGFLKRSIPLWLLLDLRLSVTAALANFSRLEQHDCRTDHECDVRPGIGRQRCKMTYADRMVLGDGVSGPEQLKVGEDDIAYFGQTIDQFQVDRCTALENRHEAVPGAEIQGEFQLPVQLPRGPLAKRLGDQADCKNSRAGQQRHQLTQTGRGRDRDRCKDNDGFKYHGHADHHLPQLATVCLELSQGRLKLPPLVNQKKHDQCQRTEQGQIDDKGRGKNPAVHVIAPARQDECQKYRAEAEHQDWLVQMLCRSGHNPMADGENKDQAEYVERYGDRRGHTEILAHDEKRSRYRLADDGQDSFVFDLAGQDAGGGEGCEQQANDEKGAEAHVGHHFVVCCTTGLHAVSRKRGVQRQTGSANQDQDYQDRLSDRLGERISGNSQQLEDHPDSMIGFFRSLQVTCRAKHHVALGGTTRRVLGPESRILAGSYK